MDPFEARLQFIQILEQLNPSQVTINKAIQFCLKNEELHEDFHSCILEILDRLDLNSRINILYFLESLVSTILGSTGSKDLVNRPYVKNIKKDLNLILRKILPDDNLINLRNCFDILINLEKLYGIRNEEYINKYLNLEINEENNEINDDETDDFLKCWDYLILKKSKSLKNRQDQLNTESSYTDSSIQLTKEQMLSRMETDRERHKRFKETNWIVIRSNNNNSGKNGIDLIEFDKIWNKFDVINKDDLRELKELNEIAKESYQL